MARSSQVEHFVTEWREGYSAICGARTSAYNTTTQRDDVTCARCLRSLAAADRIAALAAPLADTAPIGVEVRHDGISGWGLYSGFREVTLDGAIFVAGYRVADFQVDGAIERGRPEHYWRITLTDHRGRPAYSQPFTGKSYRSMSRALAALKQSAEPSVTFNVL